MKVKILQWNIFYEEKIKNIIQFLSRIRPDIACLQELTNNSEWNNYKNVSQEIAKHLKLFNIYKAAQQQRNDKGELCEFGNGIFSRFPIVQTFSKYIQKPAKTFDDYSKVGRLYLEADIQIKKDALTVGTTHTSYAKRFIHNQAKKLEADKLIRLIRRKKKRFILTGDFNSLPNSYTIENLKKYLRHCGPDTQEKTWTIKPFDYRGFKEDKLHWRIDYIFRTPDIRVISSRILKTSYSDHLPILTEIEM